jgi:hypothetical protein
MPNKILFFTVVPPSKKMAPDTPKTPHAELLEEQKCLTKISLQGFLRGEKRLTPSIHFPGLITLRRALPGWPGSRHVVVGSKRGSQPLIRAIMLGERRARRKGWARASSR